MEGRVFFLVDGPETTSRDGSARCGPVFHGDAVTCALRTTALS